MLHSLHLIIVLGVARLTLLQVFHFSSQGLKRAIVSQLLLMLEARRMFGHFSLLRLLAVLARVWHLHDILRLLLVGILQLGNRWRHRICRLNGL